MEENKLTINSIHLDREHKSLLIECLDEKTHKVFEVSPIFLMARDKLIKRFSVEDANAISEFYCADAALFKGKTVGRSMYGYSKT